MSRHTPGVYDPRATTRAHHAAILLAVDSIRDFAVTANRGDREKIEIALESIEARALPGSKPGGVSACHCQR
jgi:hypothetical protein